MTWQDGDVRVPGAPGGGIVVAPGRRGRAIYDARRRRVLDAGQLQLVGDVSAEAIEWTPDDWATPPDFVRRLEDEFGAFELDPCAMPRTAKARRRHDVRPLTQ